MKIHEIEEASVNNTVDFEATLNILGLVIDIRFWVCYSSRSCESFINNYDDIAIIIK